MMNDSMGVWFPTIQAGTGVDRFTERLVAGLRERGIMAEIAWLPHRAEFLPWSVRVPHPPAWAKVIHVNSWLHSRFFPPNLPRVVTLHSCVHDPRFEAYKSNLQAIYHNWWVYKREAQALSSAQKVTAVSHYTGLVAEKMFNHDPIKVIPNWIDSSIFVPGRPHFGRTPFRLLFVGNLSSRKGADLLPEIMRQLGSDFELRYTGSAEELGSFGLCPENAIPLGQLETQSQLIKAYQESDALIFPTRLEGLPLVTLEAGSCGLPVIGSDCCSLPEVVIDGVTGILCEQDDVSAFVNAARKLRSSPSLCKEMSEKSRNYVVDKFSESRVIDEYIAIYEELVHNSNLAS